MWLRPFSSFDAYSMTRRIGFARAAVSPCFGAGPPSSPSVTERGDRYYVSSICLYVDDQSHAGVLGYAVDDFEVAVELAALLTRQDVHPAVT